MGCWWEVEGKDLPQDDPQHDPYLSYYEDIEFAEGRDFYFSTLDAAASDSMHYMTDAEILQYGLATEWTSRRPKKSGL